MYISFFKPININPKYCTVAGIALLSLAVSAYAKDDCKCSADPISTLFSIFTGAFLGAATGAATGAIAGGVGAIPGAVAGFIGGASTGSVGVVAQGVFENGRCNC